MSLLPEPADAERVSPADAESVFRAASCSSKATLAALLRRLPAEAVSLRDPKTGRSPLMGALLAGRQPNARELVARGASLDEADRDGVRASAYMLLGRDAAAGHAPPSRSFAAFAAAKADWSLACSKGYPVALQASRLLSAHKPKNGMAARLCGPSSVLKLASECGVSLRALRFPDGSSFASGYLAALPRGPHFLSYGCEDAVELLRLCVEAEQPDGALLCAASILSVPAQSRAYDARPAALAPLFLEAASLPIGAEAARALPAAAASFGARALGELQSDFPSLFALAESALLSEIPAPPPSAHSAPRRSL